MARRGISLYLECGQPHSKCHTPRFTVTWLLGKSTSLHSSSQKEHRAWHRGADCGRSDGTANAVRAGLPQANSASHVCLRQTQECQDNQGCVEAIILDWVKLHLGEKYEQQGFEKDL